MREAKEDERVDDTVAEGDRGPRTVWWLFRLRERGAPEVGKGKDN